MCICNIFIQAKIEHGFAGGEVIKRIVEIMLDSICFNDTSSDNLFYMNYSNVQRFCSLH